MASAPDTSNYYDIKEMSYDLRAKYAQIVGEVLEEIARARITEDYPRLFMLLDHLHTEINQKFTKKEKEEYKIELKLCLDILNEYPKEYLKYSHKAENVAKVAAAIKKLEMWLRSIMEQHKMFGGKSDAEGL